jgi:hypothetical protein
MAVIFDPLISNVSVEDYSIPAMEPTTSALDTSLSAVFPYLSIFPLTLSDKRDSQIETDMIL